MLSIKVLSKVYHYFAVVSRTKRLTKESSKVLKNGLSFSFSNRKCPSSEKIRMKNNRSKSMSKIGGKLCKTCNT